MVENMGLRTIQKTNFPPSPPLLPPPLAQEENEGCNHEQDRFCVLGICFLLRLWTWQRGWSQCCGSGMMVPDLDPAFQLSPHPDLDPSPDPTQSLANEEGCKYSESVQSLRLFQEVYVLISSARIDHFNWSIKFAKLYRFLGQKGQDSELDGDPWWLFQIRQSQKRSGSTTLVAARLLYYRKKRCERNTLLNLFMSSAIVKRPYCLWFLYSSFLCTTPSMEKRMGIWALFCEKKLALSKNVVFALFTEFTSIQSKDLRCTRCVRKQMRRATQLENPSF